MRGLAFACMTLGTSIAALAVPTAVHFGLPVAVCQAIVGFAMAWNGFLMVTQKG